MKRILVSLLVLGMGVSIVGCEAFSKKPKTDQTEEKMALQEVKPDAAGSQAEAQPAEEPAPQPEAAPMGGRIHVVQKGDTLYKLARQYYNGDASQWRRIMQANQGQIPNPNQLKVGQKLVIP
ncbi:MAG: LysM peptidoglycan-binding domain-containing protein [Phycisphaerae bacterium]